MGKTNRKYYKMKNLAYLIFLVSILSCGNKKTEPSESKETELIIGERIDGPANVRNKPNGDILFELYDNALVEVSTKPENGWYQVLVYSDINDNEFKMDSILIGRPIILDKDTIGKVLKSHNVNTGRGGDFAYAMLYGYLHQKNIKPETVIETVFKKNLSEKGRDFADWEGFIETFKLDKNAVDYDEFESFYNYENALEDPSPGFRIVLLFNKQNLLGLIHSREMNIENSYTHKLNWAYYVTFFEDYPEDRQTKFVNYMNKWIQGVD